MTQVELADKLRTLKGQVDKVLAEVQNMGNNVSPELEAAAAELAAGVQGLDDVNPDAPPAPPE